MKMSFQPSELRIVQNDRQNPNTFAFGITKGYFEDIYPQKNYMINTFLFFRILNINICPGARQLSQTQRGSERTFEKKTKR